MNARLILLTGLLTVLIAGCEKESESKAVITISGITELSVMAEQTGNVDATDWNLTDVWTATEENLFKQNNPMHLSPTETVSPDASVMVLAYPNPSIHEGLIAFAFQLTPGMYYDIRIVNEELAVGFHLDSVRYNNISIKDSSFVSNEMYRIYYKLYSEDKVYRGHGDFKFVK